MKKLIIMLLLAMFSFGTATTTHAAPPQTHLKKDGTPDKRFKENKAKGPLTKSGKPDMRFKANNPNAGKKKSKM